VGEESAAYIIDKDVLFVELLLASFFIARPHVEPNEDDALRFVYLPQDCKPL
jgi:hypothetical protein